MVDNQIGLTATTDVLKAIAEGRGLRQRMLALGYAGWGARQLDGEIRENTWLIVPPDEELLFGDEIEQKWKQAITRIGGVQHAFQ